MKKIGLGLIATALVALAACSKPAPTVENQANALEADLSNQAAALDNEASLAANAAAANATNSASATYNASAETDAVKNTH